MERLAVLAAWLINGSGNVKTPVNPVVLLGREKTHRLSDGLPKFTPEEIEQQRRDMLKRFGED